MALAKLSARRKRVKAQPAAPRVELRHDENDTPEERFLRALRREAMKRPEWAIRTLQFSGALTPSLAFTGERIMAMVDACAPASRGVDLEGAGGMAVFDPGDLTDANAGALGRVSGAHHAMLKRGHKARALAGIRDAVRAAIGAHDERIWWLAFQPLRPSLGEIRAARNLTYREALAILESGLKAARTHLADLRETRNETTA